MQSPVQGTFVVAEERGIIANPVPAKTDTAYLSVMVFGCVEPVHDLSEATRALQAMLDKYVPGYFAAPLHSGHVETYVSGMGSHVQVYRLEGNRVTAKSCPVATEAMFYPGRTQIADVRA